MYVEVSIPIALFKNFTYIVPHEYKQNIFLGQSVTVPFKSQKINGFITEIKSKSNYKGKLLETGIHSCNSQLTIFRTSARNAISKTTKTKTTAINKGCNSDISIPAISKGCI